ncbi:hypothetical protein, partial [Bacillus sp. JJ1474]
VVLLIITLISVFSLVIMSSTVNSRIHINNTEKINVSTDIAEMGITHYDTLFTNSLHNAYNVSENLTKLYEDSKIYETINNKKTERKPTQEEIIKYFNDRFCENLLEGNPIVKEVYSGKFSVENYEYNIKVSEAPSVGECQSNNSLLIVFTSEVKSDSKTTILTGEITVNKDSIGQSIGENSIPKNTMVVTNSIKGKSLTYSDSVIFEKAVTLIGNGKIDIGGTAFFKDKLVILGSKAIINIDGDAYFFQLNKNKNKELEDFKKHKFCIRGNAYIIDGSNFIPFEIPNPCSNSPLGKWNVDNKTFSV